MSEEDEDDEDVLYVAEELVDHPPGFIIDAGGSTAKIIYRSNKDYRDGKAIHNVQNSERGILRMRSFQMSELNKVIDFLKTNCDVIKHDNDISGDIDDDDDDDDDVYWMTGVTTQHFKKELESTFRIKTRLLSEMSAISNFLLNSEQFNNECFQVDLEALEWAKNLAKMLLDGLNKFNEVEEKHKKSLKQKVQQADCQAASSCSDGPATKLLNMDNRTWADEYLKFTGKIEFPCLLALLGSGGPIGVMENDGSFKFVDFVFGIGKILCGLSEELTGESDFNKFVKMAERGKLEKVDLSPGDVKNRNHKENDWYDIMPSNAFSFELGKLSSHNFNGKGQYTKDDLAIGILSCLMKFSSKIIFLNARLHNVKSVLICGSIVNHELIRHHLQRHLYSGMIMNNLKGNHLIKINIVSQPGFVCGMGVWWENVMKKKK